MNLQDIFESVKVTRSDSKKTLRQKLEEDPDKFVDRFRKKLDHTFIKVSPYDFFKVVSEIPFNNQKNLISRGDGVTIFFDGAWTKVFGIVINNDYYIHRNEL